jgi:hypothetical protein
MRLPRLLALGLTLLGLPAFAEDAAFPVQILSRPAGAEVSVDGRPVGAAPVEISLAPGRHTFALSLKNHEPLTEDVVVPARAAALSFGLRALPEKATVRIFTTADPAEILVDGVKAGVSPLSLQDVAPGPHIISAVKIGEGRLDQVVELSAGETKILKLELRAPAPTMARLRVVSSIPDAEVVLDGERSGKAPLDRADLSPGTHFITVTKDGFADWQREVKLEAGAGLEVVAALEPLAALRLTGAPPGATIYVDDVAVGEVGKDGEGNVAKLAAGAHEVILRHPGIEPWQSELSVAAGERLVLRVEAKAAAQLPSDAELARQRARSTPFGAHVLPPGEIALSAGLGYPYLLGTWSARVGVIRNLDAAAELRSFGALTELSGKGRYQLLSSGPFALAAEAEIGFGFGPQGTADFFIGGAGVASANVIEPLTATARLGAQLLADGSSRADFAALAGAGSQALGRLTVGLGLAYQMSDDLTLEGVLEAAPGQSPRHLYEIGGLSDTDPTVYGRLGVVYKF